MHKPYRGLLALTLAVPLLISSAFASSIPMGYMSFDVTGLNAAQFDVTNNTGINSSAFPDTTWPVSTSVSLTVTSLTVFFMNGGPQVFGPGYFTLNADGISLDGTPLSNLNPIIGATLVGTFNTTSLTLNDSSHVNINPNFTISLSDGGSPLQDGDLAILYGDTGSPIPEPSSLAVLGSGVGSFAFLWRSKIRSIKRKMKTSETSTTTVGRGLPFALALLSCLVFLIPAAEATTTVHLNAATSPSTGVSGVNNVNINGSGFPTGNIAPADVSITLALTCGQSGTAATANSVIKVIGTSYRINMTLPSGLSTATYYISISGKTSTNNLFASVPPNCSQVQVTQNNNTLASCVPGSSMGLVQGKTTVAAYVPNGYWEGGNTGVRVVPIEGPGSPATVATPNVVNSCGSNSQTGQSVCTANNTDVYLITGTTLTNSLTSGSNGFAGFSGGICMNCGVAVNSLTNTAAINMGVSGPSGDGIQILNLATNTFSPAVPSYSIVSENISADPNRGYILSPAENGVYDIFQTTPTGGLLEYENPIGNGGGELDSAAEDCTTGIALSTVEFTGNLYIADLTQATFTNGSPGSWTAPGQFVNFPEFDGFSAGTSGISVAPGTTHLGIAMGEFFGNEFGVFQLPSTSGSGTPSFVDYAAAYMPNTPDSNSFESGFDPHTITAYTSPNNSKAYSVIASWATGQPAYLGVVDIQCVLSAPRTPGTHYVDPSYDLIANGCVRYVQTF